MTQIFTTRPELMAAGETTHEHKRWQKEEAALVEKDRANTGLKGGLFRGCFRRTRRRQWAAIRDHEDGVDRCPECTWELEDGICPQCSIPESSDSDGHDNWDEDLYGMDAASMEEVLGIYDEDARIGRITNPDFSEHAYSSEDGSAIGRPQMRHRVRRHSEEEPNYDSFLDDTDEDSEDEEADSLEGFVVNDIEDGPHSVISPTRSLHWETDEGTDEEVNQPQDSDNGGNSQDEEGSNETTLEVARYDPEDDESDEGPILRSRRQVQRRPEVSRQSSGSDARGGSGVSQALNALRVRNGYNGSRASANAHGNFPQRNPDTRGERSAGGSIEIQSDSDSPVPAQHTWRRRAIANRPTSNDDSEVEVSSGTATVGRDSPRLVSGWTSSRSEDVRTARQTSNASSPIHIGSSPMRPTDDELAIPGAFPQRLQHHTLLDTNDSRHISRTPTRANRRGHSSFRDTSTRRPPTNNSPPNGLQQRRGARRRSPFPPRTHPQSPTSTQSHSPTATELFEQSRRERQAQKIERRAERRRLKAEREQRGRPQNGPSLSPEPSNQYEDL